MVGSLLYCDTNRVPANVTGWFRANKEVRGYSPEFGGAYNKAGLEYGQTVPAGGRYSETSIRKI